MADFNFDLEGIEDFADVQLSAAGDYQDQTDPAPLPPGNWRLRVDEGGRKMTNDGEPINDKGYPQVHIRKVTVVEPEEFAGRVVYPFKDYSLKPLGFGPRPDSVPVVDLLRAFDDTLVFSTGKEAITLLMREIENGNTFRVNTNWTAKDSNYIREELDSAGGFDSMDPEERKAMFKKAIIRGQKNFPKKNGQFIPEWEGPSGDTYSARVSFGRLYPSSKDNVKLGPSGTDKK